MGIAALSQITDPAAKTLETLSGAVNLLTVLQQVQADSNFLPSVAKQLADAYALTQPEKNEREAAIQAVKDAQAALSALQQQMTDLQAQIASAKAESDADIKGAKDAADQYVKNSNATISARWQALDKYKGDLDTREVQVQVGEAKNTQDAQQNQATKDALDLRQSKLQGFADALAKIAANVPALENTQEQSTPTE